MRPVREVWSGVQIQKCVSSDALDMLVILVKILTFSSPRGGHGSPETSAADTDEMNTLSVSDTSELEPLKLSQPEAPYPVTTAMNDQRAQQQQRLHGNDLKRRKSGYVTYTPAKPESSTSFYSAPNPPAPVPNDLPLQPQPLHQSHPTFTAQFRPLPPSQYTAPSHNMSFSSTPVSTLSGSHYPVHALAYSAPPGNYILTGSGDKKIRLFNPFPSTDGSRGAVKAGKLIQEFNGHGYEVSDICVAR